jgi:excisionase family DNA binding protein
MVNPFEELNTRLERIESLLTAPLPAINNIQPIEKPITTKELCSFLNVSEPTIIRWKKKGKIPFLQIGGSVRFCKASVIKALEKNVANKQ